MRAIEEECLRNNQHPGGGVLEADEARLKVSLPLNDGSRVSRTFSQSEVLEGDLNRLAYNYYESYKKSR